MKRLVIMLGAAVFATAAFAGVNWEHNYDTALEKAQQGKKLVMVDVYTDWCGWCKKLDKDTYSDKDVAASLAKDFIALKINPEQSNKNKQLAAQLGTRGFPHIVFLDAKGKKLAEINGYLPADKFQAQLKRIVEQAAQK